MEHGDLSLVWNFTNNPEANIAAYEHTVQELRKWHKSKVKRSAVLSYHYNNADVPNGQVKFEHGQYTLKYCTDEKGDFRKAKYNHTDVLSRHHDLHDTFRCKKLGAPDAETRNLFSYMIDITSESARSDLVFNVYKKLIRKGSGSLKKSVEDAISQAINNYGQTAGAFNINIHAGDENWRPLTAQDYRDYFEDDPTVNVDWFIEAEEYAAG